MTGTALAVQPDLFTKRGLAGHYAAVHARLMRLPDVAPTLHLVPPADALPIADNSGCPLNMLSPPSWRFLVAVVAARTGVHARDIQGRSRARPVVSARHDAVAMVYTHGDRSFPQMGRMFGLDHSTILYIVRKRGVTKLSLRPSAKAPRRIPPMKAPTTPLNHAVVAGYMAGKPVKVIAAETGSPPGSIRAMARLMGIRHPNARRPQLPRKSDANGNFAALSMCNTNQEHSTLSTQSTGEFPAG